MKERAGFVLIAALWLIVALSAVALDAALRSQPARLAAANRLDQTRAREAALAGTDYARARLSEAMVGRADELRAEAVAQGGGRRRRASAMALLSADDVWRDPQDLVPDGMAFGDAEFNLDVRDTGLRLNLNQADEEMTRRLLAEGLRIDYSEADHLTQAILDWRDEDDLPRLNGGEREQYLEDGLPVLPPNRPFSDIDELRHVRGMTPEVFAALEPVVSVIGSGRININAAPEAVLFSVPHLSAAAIATLSRLRASEQYPRSLTELTAMLGRTLPELSRSEESDFTRRITFATNEVEIISDGRVTGSAVHAVVHTVVARADVGALVLWRRIE